MERVVGRSDLLSEASTPPSSPDLSKITTLGDFEFVNRKQDLHTGITRQEDVNEDEDELDFQLFAPSAKKSDAPVVAKIRIATPEASEREPGFIRPNRNDSYYFRKPVSTEERRSYEAAALSGQDILMASQKPWPGMAYPWKLLEIPASRKQQLLLDSSDVAYRKLWGHHAVCSTHKRPGKKSRIKMRTKAAAAKAKQAQAQEAAASKEAAEQEKRTRRNREKKVKKKNREKAKKAEAALTASAAGDAGMADSEPDVDND
ncbi:hypothetical protein HII31_04283 [Pseudocercospora fuligena]|uniref:Uncharacterized protein n=1 Tax=Pseudocercospora fuligena TaxID=685502 RepID=A0A8H6RNP5_9PEZI|nr:hypothetical protein HII31_04283 [Pseudocercospora fuligena]